MPPPALGVDATEPTRLRQVAFVSNDLERERHLFVSMGTNYFVAAANALVIYLSFE
jgi:hypothetical protein